MLDDIFGHGFVVLAAVFEELGQCSRQRFKFRGFAGGFGEGFDGGDQITATLIDSENLDAATPLGEQMVNIATGSGEVTGGDFCANGMEAIDEGGAVVFGAELAGD